MNGDQGRCWVREGLWVSVARSLASHFGSNPVAREVQEGTITVTKRGWEVNQAPCPSTSTATHTGKAVGRQRGRVVSGGRDQGSFWASGPRKAALHRVVPALKGGRRWQCGAVGGGGGGALLSFKDARQSMNNTGFLDRRGPGWGWGAASCGPGAPSRVPAH